MHCVQEDSTKQEGGKKNADKDENIVNVAVFGERSEKNVFVALCNLARQLDQEKIPSILPTSN